MAIFRDNPTDSYFCQKSSCRIKISITGASNMLMVNDLTVDVAKVAYRLIGKYTVHTK